MQRPAVTKLSGLGDNQPVVDETRLLTLLTGISSEGWPYYPGKQPRLEPTCWTLLALCSSAASSEHVRVGSRKLTSWQQPNGWLLEDPLLPVNIGFNALAAFTLISQTIPSSDNQRRGLFDALISAKGLRVENEASSPQDNTLQGWAWV